MTMALVTTLVIVALAALIHWGRPLNDDGKPLNNRLGAVVIVTAALIWAIYRAAWLHDVNWLFIRPLEAGWIIPFVIAELAVIALAMFRLGDLATLISWITLGLAVLLPFRDIFTSEFWVGWVYGPLDEKLIILCLIGMSFLFLRWFGRIAMWTVLSIAALMIVVWGWTAASGNSQLPTVPLPSDTVTTTSPSPGTSTTTAKPTTTASVSATSAPSGALVTDTAITTWKELGAKADADFKRVVDTAKKQTIGSQTGSPLAKSKTWTSEASEARLVVVFAPVGDISDERARELAGVDESIQVTRATGCYTPYDGAKVCPSGDQRVVLTLAPTLVNDEGMGLVDDWGLLVLKTEDGKSAFWPIAYQ